MNKDVVSKVLKLYDEFSKNDNLDNELEEIIELIKEYNFIDIFYYLFKKHHDLRKKGTPVADIDSFSTEYLFSLILALWVDEIWFKKWNSKIFEKIVSKVSDLWFKSCLLISRWIEDEFLSKVNGSFLLVKWNDYDEHLFDYLLWLFTEFNDFFQSDIWGDINNAIDLYKKSRLINSDKPFVVKLENNWENKIINLFSTELWSNKEFLLWNNWWLYWNKSIVPSKTVLKYNSEYYFFNPLLYLRNIKSVFEKHLKTNNKYWEKYQKSRARYLENKSIEYLIKILPWSKYYSWLKYHIDKVEYETDWIVIYDNNLFIIEAKAGELDESSKRGAPKSLDKDIEKLINNAYNQAIRTKEYIESNNISHFLTERKDKIYLKRSDFSKIFLLNVTWDYLWEISLDLDRLNKRWNLNVKYNFLSIYINELRIFSELIEFPSQFILFLERRFTLDKIENIRFADWLDMFMYFLKQWLYFDDNNNDKLDYIQMDTTLSHEIDQYYIKKGKKPVMNINPKYKEFINKVEKVNSFWFSEVSTLLLWINWDTFLDFLDKSKKQFLNDWLEHTWTLIFDSIWVGIVYIIYYDEIYGDKYLDYSKAKIFQSGINKMYNIFIKINKKNIFQLELIPEKINIVKLNNNDSLDDYVEMISTFQSKWLDLFHDMDWKKVYKKSPCICWSWKKFKRCCYDKYYGKIL